jgi:hypothetical protein
MNDNKYSQHGNLLPEQVEPSHFALVSQILKRSNGFVSAEQTKTSQTRADVNLLNPKIQNSQNLKEVELKTNWCFHMAIKHVKVTKRFFWR